MSRVEAWAGLFPAREGYVAVAVVRAADDGWGGIDLSMSEFPADAGDLAPYMRSWAVAGVGLDRWSCSGLMADLDRAGLAVFSIASTATMVFDGIDALKNVDAVPGNIRCTGSELAMVRELLRDPDVRRPDGRALAINAPPVGHALLIALAARSRALKAREEALASARPDAVLYRLERPRLLHLLAWVFGRARHLEIVVRKEPAAPKHLTWAEKQALREARS